MHTASTLPKPWDTRYTIARVLLVSAFVASGIYFTYLVLFPSQSSVFDFKNPQASKNTLLDPHAPDNTPLEKGTITTKVPLVISAALMRGDYSLLHITLTPTKKSALPTGVVLLQKSYRAFFLPLGDPITTPNPSESAFHSGALLSFADGVFLIDGTKVRPIGDATIFENLGYHWEDVVPASEEDMGMFEKGKIVLLGNMHPDGTVLYDPDTHHYFLIQDGKKHLIQDEAIAQSYLHGTHPIIISEQSLDTIQSCPLILSGLLTKSYDCSTPIDTLKNFPGDSYRFTVQLNGDVSFQTMEAVFSDTINPGNMKASLSQIKQRIFSHYGSAQ
jgi:hypothetical protein